MRGKNLNRLIISAAMIALGYVLPMFLGNVMVLNQSISPMHIPAMITGLTCGPVCGAVVGLVTPLLRSALLGMPPFPLVAVPMAFELAVYGLISGLLYPLFLRVIRSEKLGHIPAMLVTLLIAMIAGRLVGGAAKAIVMGMNGKPYGFEAFISAYFVSTAVGAVIHLIVVPVVVTALEKAKLSPMMQKQ